MEDVSRREIRRRKILENADARLRMIAGGKSHREDPPSLPDDKVCNGNVARENPAEAFAVTLKKESIVCDSQHSSAKSSSPTDHPGGELLNGSPKCSPVKEKPVDRSVNDVQSQQSEAISKLSSTITASLLAESWGQADQTVLVRGNMSSGRIYVIMALFGVVIRLMYEFQLGWMFNEMLVAPFLVITCPLLYSNILSSVPPSGILPSVLLMSGIPPHRIKYLFGCFIFVRSLFQFFSVYFLSFIISHRVIQYFTNVT